MKKVTLATFMLLSFLVEAQVSSLHNLASGKLNAFYPIKELNEDVYGYLSIYDLGKTDKRNNKYQYIILDKNLNKVSKNTFEAPRYAEWLSPEKVNNSLVITYGYSFAGMTQYTWTYNRVINLKTNKVSEPFYYDNDKFVDGHLERKGMFRKIRKNKTYEFPFAVQNGILVFKKIKKKNSYLKELKDIEVYNVNRNLKWKYEYNPNKEKISLYYPKVSKSDILLRTRDLDNLEIKIHSINPYTGKRNYTYVLQGLKPKYNHDNWIKSIGNKTVVGGALSSFKKSGFSYKRSKGLFKIELDKKGKELSKKYFLWKDAAKFIEISDKGKLDGGYYIKGKDFFMLRDGSSVFLAEKTKFGSNKIKTTDFLVMSFDKNFNLKDVKTIEKAKSKSYYSDYMYSQYVKNDTGVVFFYADYKKNIESRNKNWVLGIVSISNGKINHEQIPISSKKHVIYPYIAKDGYILLREYNKDKDYDQIRLEKLNY